MLVAIAGLPAEIANPFAQRLTGDHQHLRVLAAPPSRPPATYSPDYLDDLHGRVVRGLRKAPEAVSRRRWDLNLVILFLDAGSTPLVERFGLETLLAPIDPHKVPVDAKSKSQVNRTVNVLREHSRRLLRSARQVLATVAHEVTVRDNKTCMLLPRANYGTAFDAVAERVQGAVRNGGTAADLLGALKQLDGQLGRDGKGHFKGKGGLVFETPAKAGARHGLAPDWDAGGHEDSCVIRGTFDSGCHSSRTSTTTAS